jgi:hypothetical protein
MPRTAEWQEGIKRLREQGQILLLFNSSPCPKCGDPYEFFSAESTGSGYVRTYGHYSVVKRTCVLTNAEFEECLRLREIRRRRARAEDRKRRSERRLLKAKRKRGRR